MLRLDGVISPETAAALRAEGNATLDRELARARTAGLPSDSFGNVYCKGNRYDLKLPLSGVASAALKVSGAGEAYDPVVQDYVHGYFIAWEEAGRVWLRTFTDKGLGPPIALSGKDAGRVNLTTGNKGELLAVWSEAAEQHRRIMYAGLSIEAAPPEPLKRATISAGAWADAA